MEGIANPGRGRGRGQGRGRGKGHVGHISGNNSDIPPLLDFHHEYENYGNRGGGNNYNNRGGRHVASNENYQQQEHHPGRGRGGNRWNIKRGGHVANFVKINVNHGMDNKIKHHGGDRRPSINENDSVKEVLPGSIPDHDENRKQFERKGPVFGFKRLHGFLSSPQHTVILSITKDKLDWKDFLESDQINPSNPRNNLHLVMQILAEKIIGGAGELAPKISICAPTMVENFRKSIIEQCLQIMMSSTSKKSSPPPLIRNLKSTFIEIDKSPETFLRNVVTYCVFMISLMLPMTIEFFPSLITNVIGSVSWVSKSNSGFDTRQILHDCQSVMQKLQLFSQKQEDPHQQDTETFMHFQIELMEVEDNVHPPPGSGGGLPKCNAILPCSHHCELGSHTKDPGHQKYACKKPCLKFCLNEHPCRSVCFKKCPPCQVTMVKTLPQCGHAAEMLCCDNPAEYLCKIGMKRKLPCGHEAELACHLDPTEYTCKVKMSRILPCQEHQQILECHVDPGSQTCKISVKKKLPCGHLQDLECHLSPDVIKCKTNVQITLVECGHTLDVPCTEKTNKRLLICRNPCSVRLSCGHACPKICQHTAIDPIHSGVPCKKNCSRACKAGHPCLLIHKCDTPCPPCKNLVVRNLACGHQKELPCHLDPTQYKCIESCTRRLRCSHKCENLCFEECGPCTAVVEKNVPSCFHRILVTCSVQPTQAMCMQLVKPINRSLCGHDVKVLCKIRNTDAAQVTALCTEPCKDLLSVKLGGCGHRCKGTCSSCWQGRLHAKCGVECGRILICGDVCDFPCSNHECPPCNKKCPMKCEHSECGEQCGTPCLDCNERCSWQCVHKRCTKFCRELCDRSPCDEPCRKLLRCGHPCVGFCGEPCPPHCRTCDGEQLTGFILSGREKDANSRFIFLPDCKHSIEVEGLTKHINSTTNKFGSKKCPRCRTRINYCRRFNNVIRAELEDVIVERDMLFGDYEAVKCIHRQVIEKLQCDEGGKLSRNFPNFYNHLVNQLVDIVPSSRSATQLGVFGQRGGSNMDRKERWTEKKVNEQVLKSISFLIGCAETGMEVLIHGRNASRGKESLTPELSGKLHTRYLDLFVNIQNRKLPLSRMEKRDISRELSRLKDLCEVYLGRSNPKYKDANTRAFQFYVQALQIVEEQGPYLGLKRFELNGLLKKLEEVLKLGAEISAAERQQILAKFASTGQGTPGLWYKCRFGQYYEIVEENGAGAVLKCHKCTGQIDFDSETTTSTNSSFSGSFYQLRESDVSYQLLSRLTGTTERELRQIISSTVLSPSSTNYQNISIYFTNTQCHNFNVRVTNIFKIRRFDDVNCFGGDRANRKLLWHGTKGQNVGGILSRGFSRPAQGGQMFGTGTYFADRASKSIQYCGVPRTSRFSKGYLFVCSVALGRTHIASSANHSFQAPPSGYDSIMGVGKSIPDGFGRRTYLDAEIPCGKTVQTTSSSVLQYNEYIVYDMDRITIKFLLEFEVI